MIKLLKYAEPYILLIIAAIILLFGQAICDLSLPDYMSDIINKGITVGDKNFIIKTGFTMLGISLLSAVFTIIVSFLAAKIAAGMCRTIRNDLFTNIETFSNAEFDKFSTSSLITRTTNDITQIQMLIVMSIRMIFYAPIMAIGGFVHALANSKSMSWIIALAIICLLGLILTIFTIAMPKFKIIQNLIDKLNLVVRENLDGILVIRAFNTQEFEENRFDKANKDLTDTNLFVNRVMVSMMPIMTLIMNLVTVLIVWVGANQVSGFKMDVGEMMAYMQYVMQIIFAFLMLSMMFIMIPRASVSGDRIADVLEAKTSIKNNHIASKIDNCTGLVEFKNVCFRYPGGDEDVLNNISFTARPGETTAFIGSTGSGKSSIINLIPRFYDPSSGEVLIDGINIKNIDLHELRKNIGYVPQKGILFSGTIKSNLSYADKNASDENILRAASIAQAMEFIDSKPERFDEIIAQGGNNVSGGQKQRLSIARALLSKPQIAIFDDSFSALDFKTDAALRKALKKETGSSTVLLVAQRISTIMNAEQIIVLDNGHIAGKGTHENLMKTCNIYREIALSQLSQEELS
ncbi:MULTISPECIES: ABC transporter ATP-binding protein [Clostridium]|jgi:ATP-binding cassette subfamily B protein|uniref:Multidrug ABC transporter ATP-binding protein n=1 Tax=Clostridium butyricum TaxID=1492 RepID=A0A512TBV9_CLOBU|nr:MULTISPECIES: ABC transporter ATP-binding protein [Clostridium]APF24897.1 ABC transporter family protein [Clostridium butyricum]KIU07471.1 ABC transporter, ATP-binding/permease protein [Clostridium butyricum]MBA8967305.1 ATP-binding cassette subfamily B protein [Clostridium butyricum]MBA8971629.1 ATP-binding cassette subfamily B protein [Clostridium butyricum]MBC2427310.1 ABC transporter ATP-binding protein [Clostridium butyricum]